MLVPKPRKIAPDRLIGNQRMPIEHVGKNALADRLRFLDRFFGEAVTLPSRAIALDQERAHVRRVSVVMGIEAAEIRLHERLRQSIEDLGRAVPSKLVAHVTNGCTEIALEAAPHQRVESIGGNDQLVTNKLVKRVDLGLEMTCDASRLRTRLQNSE